MFLQCSLFRLRSFAFFSVILHLPIVVCISSKSTWYFLLCFCFIISVVYVYCEFILEKKGNCFEFRDFFKGFYELPLYLIYPQVPAAKTVAVLAAPLFAVGFSIGKFPGFSFTLNPCDSLQDKQIYLPDNRIIPAIHGLPWVFL